MHDLLPIEYPFIYFVRKIFISKVYVVYGDSYCMVCAYVREDNPRDLASGLCPVHTHNYTITCCTSMDLHFVHCEIFDIKHLNNTPKV